MDDVFCLFNDSNQCQQFLEYMNSRHRCIKFTIEHEENNSLLFFDCLVTRSGEEFSTSVFRKSSFSGVYTHFVSFLPSVYKTNIIMGLIHRCFKLCSSMKNFHLEIVNLKEIFKKNGYPSSLIDTCIKRYLNKLYRPKPKPTDQPIEQKKDVYLVLPFLGVISTRLKRKLLRTFQSVNKLMKVIIIFRSSCKVQSFLSYKDRIPLRLKSHLIYHFKCSCCNAAYIGQTTRHYDVRVCEHLKISEFTGKHKASVLETSVSNHTKVNNHLNDKDSFSIITCHSPSRISEYKLQLQETLLVAKLNPSINKQCRSVPLLLF